MPLLLFILLIGVAVLAGVAVIGMLARDQVVKPYVAERIREDFNPGIQAAVREEIAAQPSPPVNEPIVVTEAQINENISGYNLGPVGDLTVDLQPGGVDVDLEAYGFSGSYNADLLVENGGLVLENGSFSGPLSMVVPIEEVERAAYEALTAGLTDAGYTITAIEVLEDSLELELAQ